MPPADLVVACFYTQPDNSPDIQSFVHPCSATLDLFFPNLLIEGCFKALHSGVPLEAC